MHPIEVIREDHRREADPDFQKKMIIQAGYECLYNMAFKHRKVLLDYITELEDKLKT